MSSVNEMRVRTARGKELRQSEETKQQKHARQAQTERGYWVATMVPALFGEQWLPKMHKAADAGEQSVTVHLFLDGLEQSNIGLLIHETSVFMREEGYHVEFETKVRKHSDDDPGSDETNMIITW